MVHLLHPTRQGHCPRLLGKPCFLYSLRLGRSGSTPGFGLELSLLGLHYWPALSLPCPLLLTPGPLHVLFQLPGTCSLQVFLCNFWSCWLHLKTLSRTTSLTLNQNQPSVLLSLVSKTLLTFLQWAHFYLPHLRVSSGHTGISCSGIGGQKLARSKKSINIC